MNRLLAGATVLALGTVAVASLPARAWDTCVSEPLARQWLSVYLPIALCPTADGFIVGGVQVADKESHSRNEHPQIADIALGQLLQGGLFGAQSGVQLDVVDLNASLFRAEALKGTARRTLDESLAPLETRELPAPVRFAGLPDYSFTVYDWINKNTVCPSLPPGTASNDLCHTFIPGWLGALNSSHFGTQAARNYSHLHVIALGLAEKAADMRRKLEAADAEGRHLRAHEKFLKEAELAALTYEGMAQHFLQDRWAVGHMWERWGSSNHDELQGGFVAATLIGGLTGTIHGSEAVFGPPDMMSSPDVEHSTPKKLHPAEFVQGAGPKHFAVGDYRLRDMERGFFGGDYPSIGVDLPLPVSHQRSELLRCGMAGWAEVIRAFGDHKGGFGIHGARIASDPGPMDDCFNPWVTNNTVKRGAVDDPILGKALGGRVTFNVVAVGTAAVVTGGAGAIVALLAADAAADSQGYSARELVRLFTRISWDAYWEPDGTSLARGGIGAYDAFSTGQHFGASKFLEPKNLDELPDDDARGRDKKSVHGFFNRALTDHWCRVLPETLEKLRGKPWDSVETAACAYLGDRAFEGTDPKYKGRQAERRTLDGKAGAPPIKPICQALGVGGFAPGKTPAALHPGYVATSEWGLDSGGPYARARPDVSTYSVKNWCRRLPVLDLIGAEEPSADDLIAEVEDLQATIAVRGHDLGATKGRLRLRALDGIGGPFDIGEIEAWSDTEIRFKLPSDRRREGNDYLAMVTTSDDRQSVGRFIVRARTAPPKIESVRLSRGSETFYDHPKGGFRPVTPGQVTVEIAFTGDMDRRRPVELRLEALQASGSWQSGRAWRGTLEVPDGDAFKKLRGAHRLAIQAYARDGSAFRAPEAGPDAPPVPNRTHRVVVDTIPPILEHVAVTADGLAYEAEWTGGPDLAAVKSFIDGAATPTIRRLNIKTARRLPQRGSAQIELRFSADLDQAPVAHVGGADVILSGSARSWRGTFDIAKAFAGAVHATLEVTAADRWGNRLDGNPSTLATLSLPPADPVPVWWLHDEDGGGAVDTGKGGTDAQHTIGERPPSIVYGPSSALQRLTTVAPFRRNARFPTGYSRLVPCAVLWNFEWDEHPDVPFLFTQPMEFRQPVRRATLPMIPGRPPPGLPPAELGRWFQEEQARLAAERGKARQDDEDFDAKAKADHENRLKTWEEYRGKAEAATAALRDRQKALAATIGEEQKRLQDIGAQARFDNDAVVWTGVRWDPVHSVADIVARYQPQIDAHCDGIGRRLASALDAQQQAVAALRRIHEEWWAWTEQEYARVREAAERARGPQLVPRVPQPEVRRAAAPPPPPAPKREKVVCRPTEWKGLKVEERGPGPLHDIVLQEISYNEHELPDGGCVADLAVADHAVSYGWREPTGDGIQPRKPWSSVAKKPVKVDARHGASGDGAAALESVRARAIELKSAVLPPETAQARVEEMVQRNLAR